MYIYIRHRDFMGGPWIADRGSGITIRGARVTYQGSHRSLVRGRSSRTVKPYCRARRRHRTRGSGCCDSQDYMIIAASAVLAQGYKSYEAEGYEVQ